MISLVIKGGYTSMAAKHLVSLLSLASMSLTIILLSHPVNATNVFTVGDEKGWTLGFDYQAWAQDKQFHVGDILVFNYPKGVHNVLVVNGSSFANCVKEPISGKFESGQDKVQIKKSGNIWFICGVGQHCQNSLKLQITVVDESSQYPTSAASPSPSPALAPESSSYVIGDFEENGATGAPSFPYRSRPW